MKILASLILLLFAVGSVAQLPGPPTSITLTWEAPDQRIDGSVLQESELAGYVLNNSCAAEPYVIPDGEVKAYVLPVTIPFDCSFSIEAVDTDGLRSLPSESLRVNFNAPNPPVFNQVQIN